MKSHFAWGFALVMLLCALPILSNADIAAKQGNLALFLKPSWVTGQTTTTRKRASSLGWSATATNPVAPPFVWNQTGSDSNPSSGVYFGNSTEYDIPSTKRVGHGGRQFYQYEDYAGEGILYTVAPSAKGLPSGYRHKGTVVVSEIGWSKQTPLTAQDVWAIWEGIPDTHKNRKQGVTQIQLLSDELFGTCYDLDNKYGNRDLRILVYGAELTGDAEEDKKIVEAQIIRALNGEGLETKAS